MVTGQGSGGRKGEGKVDSGNTEERFESMGKLKAKQSAFNYRYFLHFKLCPFFLCLFSFGKQLRNAAR